MESFIKTKTFLRCLAEKLMYQDIKILTAVMCFSCYIYQITSKLQMLVEANIATNKLYSSVDNETYLVIMKL